jgi:lipid II:glycine glycyltransferase (peptidoglycan interpeptide bridge formation enzyme)
MAAGVEHLAPADFDALTAGRASFLQSSPWAAVKAAGGWVPERLVVRDGDDWIAGQLLLRDLPAGLGRLAYLPRGPLLTTADTGQAARLRAGFLGALRDLGAQGVTLVRVEGAEAAPLRDGDDPCRIPDDLRAAHAAPWQTAAETAGIALLPVAHGQPPTTRLLDLRPGLAAVRAGYKSSQRSTIRTAVRHGLQVEASGDPALAHRLLAAAGARTGIAPRSAAALGDLLRHAPGAELLIAADPQLGPVGALLSVQHGDRAVYLYAGATDEGNRRRAPYLLIDAAIARAAGRGAAELDLWGLPTRGIADFKAGWGGTAVALPVAFDLPLDPLRGRAARLALRLRAGRG